MLTNVCKDYLDLMASHGDVIVVLSDSAQHRSQFPSYVLQELAERYVIAMDDRFVRLTRLGVLLADAIRTLEKAADKMALAEDILRKRDNS